MKIFAVLVFLVVAALVLRESAEKFFFQNTEYSLHHLDAKLDGVMTQEELVSLTGFEEGKNIFQMDLDQANRKIAALPEVRTVTLERQLPDTIRISIERRTPVFLFAGTGDAAEAFVSGKSFLCDKEGVLLQPSRLDPEFLNLPVLKGVDLGEAKPGVKLENEQLTFAALLFDSLSEIPEESFKVRSIDVSKGYSAVLTDSSNARYIFGKDDLPGQIERLKKLLAHCEETGRQIETANLMVTRNTPVTFVLTPETGASKITPVSTPKKSAHKATKR